MKQMRVVVGLSLILLTVLSSFTIAGAADAPPGSGLELQRFYSGPLGHTGTFRGKLLCLCCDLMPDPGKREHCDKNHHQAVLSIEEDGSLHPLIAGTAEVTKQMNSDALHGKQVAVSGNYYPSTGLIFVNKIEPR
jgi:hypothetical protein